MVVLEPSCWAAFQDELGNLLPNDQDAHRLRALTFTLSGFLQSRANGYRPPPLRRAALVHGHCHQKALDALDVTTPGKLASERALFDQMQLQHREPELGCCGMAGAFGYERGNDHYAVSVACGERALLPEVRRAPAEELLVADGFSCREQIRQQTGRTALHTAQVVQMAIRGEAVVQQVRGMLAEVAAQARRRRRAGVLLALGIGGAALLIGRRSTSQRALARLISRAMEA
jgi:Fe-S oxidoreductase